MSVYRTIGPLVFSVGKRLNFFFFLSQPGVLHIPELGLDCLTNEPPRGKTNNVVSEQVWHKQSCTSLEDGSKLEILYLRRRGIVLSV